MATRGSCLECVDSMVELAASSGDHFGNELVPDNLLSKYLSSKIVYSFAHQHALATLEEFHFLRKEDYLLFLDK